MLREAIASRWESNVERPSLADVLREYEACEGETKANWSEGMDENKPLTESEGHPMAWTLLVLLGLLFAIRYATDRLKFCVIDFYVGLVMLALACVVGACWLTVWIAMRGRG